MAEANPLTAGDAAQPEQPRRLLSTYQRARLLLGAAVGGSFAIFWVAGALFDIPVHRGFEASLLQQPWPWGNVVVTAVALVACVLLGTAIAGTVRFEAGLFAAALGVSALSLRGGPMRYVLFWADVAGGAPGIFVKLAAELLLLYAILLAGWAVLHAMRQHGWLARNRDLDGVQQGDEPLAHKLAATGVQAAFMAAIVMIVAPVDDKQQVLAAVGLGAWAATAITHYAFYATAPSIWYWSGPFVVGLLGYLLAWQSPAGWQTGHLHGPFSGLARPLPLDYASFGTAGAILGYWMSRRWHRDKDETPEMKA